jgi:hypothetical protein
VTNRERTFRMKWQGMYLWVVRWPSVLVYPAVLAAVLLTVTVIAWWEGVTDRWPDACRIWRDVSTARRDWKSTKDDGRTT